MSSKTIQKSADPLTLFSLDDLAAAQATGSPWEIDGDTPATVPVPLQTVIMKVEGPYTAQDRKLWAFLVHAAFDDLGKKQIHEFKVSDINAVFRECGGKHETEWIWQSAKRLAKTTCEWETKFDDPRFDDEQGISAIFFAMISKNSRRTGTLKFGFPAPLVPIIQHPLRFSRLRIHFLLTLSGKYAVTLYEVLEGFVNRRDGRLEVSIEDLRTWLKVPEGTYEAWKDFRKRVLDPAVKQINDNPLGAGFKVEYAPVKEGRFYTRLVFKLTKTEGRKRDESWIQKKGEIRSRLEHAKAESRPVLLPEDIAAAAAKTDHHFDMRVMEAEFWDFWRSQGGKPLKSPRAAFIGFCQKKYGKK